MQSEARKRASRRYQETHREKVRELQRAWRLANAERLRERDRLYRAANKEKILARQNEYWAKHPGQRTAKYRRYRANNLEKVRNKELSKYGLTQRDYEVILSTQNYSCKICDAEAWAEKGGVLHVDHDHGTGRVRGLLCSRCNTGLGLFRDSSELLENALDYLNA